MHVLLLGVTVSVLSLGQLCRPVNPEVGRPVPVEDDHVLAVGTSNLLLRVKDWLKNSLPGVKSLQKKLKKKFDDSKACGIIKKLD